MKEISRLQHPGPQRTDSLMSQCLTVPILGEETKAFRGYVTFPKVPKHHSWDPAQAVWQTSLRADPPPLTGL